MHYTQPIKARALRPISAGIISEIMVSEDKKQKQKASLSARGAAKVAWEDAHHQHRNIGQSDNDDNAEQEAVELEEMEFGSKFADTPSDSSLPPTHLGSPNRAKKSKLFGSSISSADGLEQQNRKQQKTLNKFVFVTDLVPNVFSVFTVYPISLSLPIVYDYFI
jgi:hypothetical protein